MRTVFPPALHAAFGHAGDIALARGPQDFLLRAAILHPRRARYRLQLADGGETRQDVVMHAVDQELVLFPQLRFTKGSTATDFSAVGERVPRPHSPPRSVPPESRRRSKPPPGRSAPPPDWPGLARPYPFSARSRAGPPGPLPAARATVSPARKTGVTAPCGRRVHGTRLNGSGTSAAASRASSTTTGSKHGVPCALSSVRSAAMSSPHSSAKPPRQRTAEGTENQTRGQQGPGAVRPRGAPPKPPAAPFDAAQICFESASSFCT